jgi:DNA-binding response OmpR family regulator
MTSDTVTAVFCPDTDWSRQVDPGASGNGERILVVEDEPELMDYIATVLRTRGYEVFEAADAKSALAMLRQEAGFQLVLSDIGLPGGMDGIALAHAARDEKPGLRFLFVSGNAHDALASRGMDGSHIELLVKPFRHAELLARVRGCLDSDR